MSELIAVSVIIVVAVILVWGFFKQDSEPTMYDRIGKLEDELALEKERAAWKEANKL